MTGLREYLISNMFDGEEAGYTTRRVDQLLDDVVDNVTLFVLGADTDRIEEYFTGRRPS